MNPVAIWFLSATALALLVVPRRWAPLPLLAGACFMPVGQGINLGPLTFTVIRILIAVGVVRVIVRGERLPGGMQGLDWLMVVWALWACLISAFHEPFVDALIFRLGLAYNACGIYFLARIFCTSVDDGVRLSRTLAVLLIPLALEMVYEQVAHSNLFSIFGDVNVTPELREGRIRAQGPFAHPILAGTVGAVSLPLMIGMWRYHPVLACLGITECLVIVVASASGGPAMSTMFAVMAVFMWPYRRHMKTIRRAAVCFYIGLAIFMKAPPYYLIARIDVVAGSNGWYRSRLIQSAFEHLDEWWFAGTDYTRHWMHTRVGENQADIVNHYLQMGVWGGLPLMFLFIAIFAKAFSRVGSALQNRSALSGREQFAVWTFGGSLGAHAATWMSVSYFDQSVVFLYLTLAAIGSAKPLAATAGARREVVGPLPADRAKVHCTPPVPARALAWPQTLTRERTDASRT